MALQLFSDRTWEEDSFNETNVQSIILHLEQVDRNRCIYNFVNIKDKGKEKEEYENL